MNKRIVVAIGVSFLFLTVVFQVSAGGVRFADKVPIFDREVCQAKKINLLGSVICYLIDKTNELSNSVHVLNSQVAANDATDATQSAQISQLEQKVNIQQRRIVDIGQVRGSLWTNTNITTNVKTPDEVTVNCPNACHLWVNFDVDTRNTVGGFQHLYMIYVDAVDQAVFNQATMTTAHAAVPLAVNGVFPVGPGQHKVEIFARSYGGVMEQHESHLQVLAIE